MFRKFVTCTTVALALIGAGATRASAQVPGNPFLIDGIVLDQNNSNVPSGYTVPPCDIPSYAPYQACKQIDPAGNAQELGPVNGSSTKIGPINTAAVPMMGTTNPNAQVDLAAGWTESKVVSVGGVNHVFFYFGWRRDSANGSGFLSIEVQKLAAPLGCTYDTSTNAQLIANCNPFANRQAGDFVLLWDQSGGSRKVVIAPFFGGPGTGQALQFPDCSHGDTRCIDLTDFHAADAQFSADGFAGEVAVDLTLAGVFSTNPTSCQTLANIIPGTVTGNSNTADYKDVILAPFPAISNCGTVNVTKATSPAGLSGTFPFTLNASAPIFFSGQVDTDCDVSGAGDTNNCSHTFTAPGTVGISNLIGQTTYQLAEDTNAMGSNFALTSISCTAVGGSTVSSSSTPLTGITVLAGGVTNCTITNTQVIGYLDIKKLVVNGYGLTQNSEDFCYSLDGGGNTAFPANQAATTAIQFQGGTVHNVVEPAACQKANYTVSYAGCSNITIVTGATQHCVVTNTATQNSPGALTRQRTLLFDRANLSLVRRAGDGSDNGTMSVKFVVYDTLASCQAATIPSLGGLSSEVVPVTFSTNTAQAVTVGTVGDGSAGKPLVEIKKDDAGDITTSRWWRAYFHQTGTNPPNGDVLTDCTELTEVRIKQ